MLALRLDEPRAAGVRRRRRSTARRSSGLSRTGSSSASRAARRSASRDAAGCSATPSRPSCSLPSDGVLVLRGAAGRRAPCPGLPSDEMELTSRKREILRLVVEEYVASGQPVGSKSLVDRSGLDLSSSTVRSELAELESLGLLTHPHTSAGRVPTESGYDLYAQELVDSIEGRPGTVPARSHRDAQRARDGAPADDGVALAGDPPARARLGSRGRHRRRPSRRGAAAATRRRPRRRDHRRRWRHEARLRARGARRRRPRRVGARVPQRDRRRAAPRRARSCAAASKTRRWLRASGRSSRCCDPHSPRSWPTPARSSTSAAPPGLLGEARGEELDACQRLLELLEQRAAVLKLLSDALDPKRTVVRVGPALDGAELHNVVYVGSPYGLHQPVARVGRAAGAAPHGLREGDPRRAGGGIRAVAARRRGLRGRLSRTWRRRSPTTTRCSACRATRRMRTSRRPSAGSPASCIPTSAWRGHGAPLPRGCGGLRGAVRPGAAADVRPLRPRRAAARRLPRDRVRPRQPVGHLRRVLRRRHLRWARRARRARPAARMSRRPSRSRSTRSSPA